MTPPLDEPSVRFAEQVRLATGLAHTVPGLALDLRLRSGFDVTVAHQRLDAQLTPCQLRTALLAPRLPGRYHTLDSIAGVAVAGGALHLGGGVYARGHSPLGGERWFATTLSHDAVVAALASDPFELPELSIEVRVLPDPPLGVSVVRARALQPRWFGVLDEVAHWAVTECLVGELHQVLQESAA